MAATFMDIAASGHQSASVAECWSASKNGRIDFSGKGATWIGGAAKLTRGGWINLEGDGTPWADGVEFGVSELNASVLPPFKATLLRTPHGLCPDNAVTVVAHRHGSASFANDHCSGIIGPGDFVIYNMFPETNVCSDGETERLILKLPIQLLPHAATRILPSVVRFNSKSGGLPAIFMRMLEATFEQRRNLSEVGRARLQRSLAAFIADLLESAVEEAGIASNMSTLASLRMRAFAFVEANLETLSGVSELADRMGCSTRLLYRAFEERGTTPSRHIWSLRLERARDQITSPGVEVSITEVAFRCGFRSYAHFSRAFREKFGVTPHECWLRARVSP